MNQVKSRAHAKALIFAHTVASVRAAGAGALHAATGVAERANHPQGRDPNAVKLAIWGLTLLNYANMREADDAHRYAGSRP